MFRLIVQRGRKDARSVELTGSLTVGRGPHNGLDLADDNLSRSHLRIDIVHGRPVVTDLDSRNGTFVNDVPVDRKELSIGDVISCGSQTLELAGDAEPEPARASDLLLRARSPVQHTAMTSLRLPAVAQGDRSREKLEILLEVSRLLSSPEPIDGVLQKILDLLFQIFEVDGAAILLARGDVLEPRAVKSTRPAEGEPLWSRHIVEHVRRTGEAVLFSDLGDDPRIADKGSIVRRSIRASMCAPLRPKQDVIGVLYVDNRKNPERFEEEDLEFLGAFANQAAIAIENAQLYKRIEDEAVLRNNLLRFFPPATIQKIAGSEGGRLEVIDAEVTALFADISGFTELSARMQPREVIELLNEYFPVMAKIVFRHEGTLEKYIGDALLAVWGAPFAHADDSDRAVRAAIEMQRATAGLSHELEERCGMPLRIHIGVNSGRVAAGNIGSDHYIQYATIGDTTNVASRICGAAPAGEIWIADSTSRKLTDGAILHEELSPLRLKGKEDDIPLRRVLWASAIPESPTT